MPAKHNEMYGSLQSARIKCKALSWIVHLQGSPVLCKFS